MSEQDQTVVVSQEYWDAIEKQATAVQVLCEALQRLTQTDGLHDLGGYAEHLEAMSGELFSLVTDEGRRRKNLVRSGSHLRLVGD